jgi:hypothetical protein
MRRTRSADRSARRSTWDRPLAESLEARLALDGSVMEGLIAPGVAIDETPEAVEVSAWSAAGDDGWFDLEIDESAPLETGSEIWGGAWSPADDDLGAGPRAIVEPSTIEPATRLDLADPVGPAPVSSSTPPPTAAAAQIRWISTFPTTPEAAAKSPAITSTLVA